MFCLLIICRSDGFVTYSYSFVAVIVVVIYVRLQGGPKKLAHSFVSLITS